MCSWCDLMNNVKYVTFVAESLDFARHQQILEYRHYIKTFISVIYFCGHQDIAVQDHRETDLNFNRGDYLELLELIARLHWNLHVCSNSVR